MKYKNYKTNEQNEIIKRLKVVQNNSCGICKSKFIFKAPVLDHCHETQEIRGLLCRKCNYELSHPENGHSFTTKDMEMYLIFPPINKL